MTLPRSLVPPRTSVLLHDVAERLQTDGLLVKTDPRDAEIRGVTDDSRAVEQGDLFCAWKGTTSDSHDFLPAAQQAGAAAAVVERAATQVDLPQLVVSDGRRGAAAAASCVYGNPADRLVLAGVTGTNGKTTTAWITRHLLASRQQAAMIGTLGLWLDESGAVDGTEALTTPGPVDLAALFRVLVDRGVGAVSMEVSSHALHQGRVHAARYDVAIFTNLTRDHLDYHHTLESYRAAKLLLVQHLRATGAVIVNADEPAWEGVARQAARAYTFSVRQDAAADVTAQNIALHERGSDFELHANSTTVRVKLPLLGDFNVQNALAAAAAALSLGYNLPEIAGLLSDVPQVPGRLERISDKPCPVLRDYAHTPDALERVLRTLRQLVRGRLIVVFGAGGDRDQGKRPQMGAIAEQLADVAIVTSDNPRTENPDTIIDQIVAGMKDGHERITDRRAAIAFALNNARTDDLVLLAGKGHENYQIVGTVKTSSTSARSYANW
jgi:UDP-N-acetylmuramoyl-L-alanyl-D-glutamate--2,6-diaminopimelate ligase